MRTPLFAATLSSLLVVSAACSKDKEQEPAPAAEAEEPKKKSNIERIQLAVPVGKQVACAEVIDPALFTQHIGDEIGEVVDKNKSNGEAAFACAMMRAGEPPSEAEQKRKYEKDGLVLGVQPGEEYCMVSGYCSMSADLDDFRKTCEERNDSSNSQLGVFACVHQSQRGSKYAYTYRVIDPDSTCILEVMGGPSVTDEILVQNCTRAALETVTKDKLKNFQ